MADSSGTPVPHPLTVPAPIAVVGNGPASPVPPFPSATPLATEFPASAQAPTDTAPRYSIAVGLKEAALDSPSFRASAVTFCQQVDKIESWLESYVRSTSKLVHGFAGLEDSVNSYLANIVPPTAAADGLIDTDHTLLALKRVSDGTRDWWQHVTEALRRFDINNAEPIRKFLRAQESRTPDSRVPVGLSSFKDMRKALEDAQKDYDTLLARYMSQSKSKDAPMYLQEVYRTRHAYFKASMDFCEMAPQLCASLDKLLTRVSADFWLDMKRTRDSATNSTQWDDEMERIRGWAKDMELSEVTLRGQLKLSRSAIKPPSELGYYSKSTVQPHQGDKADISEKQGWLFLRTRSSWVPRWFYCRDGIFGYLVQKPQGILQGDDIGVLLWSAARTVQGGGGGRFCLELKTSSQTLIMQAETERQLVEWIEVIKVAQEKAANRTGSTGPAYLHTKPSVTKFYAMDTVPLSTVEGGSARQTLAPSNTLPLPVVGPDSGPGLIGRGSFDVGAAGPAPPRRSITTLGQVVRREEGESRGEHASRLIQRLDMHRKATFGGGASGAGGDFLGPGGNGGGGMVGYPQSPLLGGFIPAAQRPHMQPLAFGDPRRGSLAPATYTKAPVMTYLSNVAVGVAVESEQSLCRPGSAGILPFGIMANYWGSQQWCSVYMPDGYGSSMPHSPHSPTTPMSVTPMGHRKTLSMDAANVVDTRVALDRAPEMFPASYPIELRTQHAQFRLLFPSVPMEEKLVLVFNAAWSSANEPSTANKSFLGSGRIYLTLDNMYFYSHTMGLVMTYAVSLDIIADVTSEQGKDCDYTCDYTFLDLSRDINETGITRIKIKTFLEDKYILRARLNLLIDNLQAAEPMEVPEILVALHNIACEDDGRRSPSIASWDQYGGGSGLAGSGSPTHHYNDGHDDALTGRYGGRHRPMHHEAGLGAHRVTSHGSKSSGVRPFPAIPKLQLPSQAVEYEPTGMQKKAVERHFDISAKACFHVLFGDKSFIFARLYFDRQAHDIEQGAWTLADHGEMKRVFRFRVSAVDMIGRHKDEAVADEQTIVVFSDHAKYVVQYVKTAWHLPHSQAFRQITTVAITHMAKSKCKLAVYVKVDWSKAPAFSKNLIERQALDDASRDAEELAELATDDVRKLGVNSRTKRAIQVYGNIGAAQTKAVLFSPEEHGVGSSSSKQVRATPRTLGKMVLETVRSFMESVVTSLVMWTFAACRTLFRVASAHRILLVVLGLSVLANVLFSSRETSAWWTERHAAAYMGKLGVGPNVAMSRTIYLADLDAAAHAVTPRTVPHVDGSACYNMFQSIANATDLDASSDDAGAMLLSPSSRMTARRLRRTRQTLATYRHDLVVAMRVVNSVEREMVQSEWENWLYDETWRCEQVYEMLLRQNRDGADTDKDGGVVAERLAMLKHWHKDYCGSCQADQQALETLAWRQSLV